MTGIERIVSLFNRLKKDYPNKDIRFKNETVYVGKNFFLKFKVSYWSNILGKDVQICDAIWGEGSYGYEDNLLEFYGNSEPIGNLTEREAYNLFKREIESQNCTQGEKK